ncbi:MAG: two-component system, chemotaxis family, sensor kinase CheA [Blastocatellia bacterium]|jgi:two-component system chemotaxis sensor kinase CheA|nr:two-component system, chemotaxis family, sensor kinase CheA [Blastocatellia bacterium]
MNELQRQFFMEAEEMLESLLRALQQLRQRRSDGRARRDLIGQIFRLIHTLKGSAGAADMESIKRIAHEFETVLDGVRLGRIAIDDAVLDAFEDAAFAISESLAAPEGKQAPAVTAELLQRLKAFAVPGTNNDPEFDVNLRASLPTDIAAALSRYDERRLREALSEGARLFVITAEFPLAEFDQEFRDLSTRLGRGGEILATVPGPQAVASGEISFRVLYATSSNSSAISTQLGKLADVKVTELEIEPGKQAASLAASDATALEMRLAPALSADTVRVQLTELDELIALTSALFRDTANTLELTTVSADGGPLHNTEALQPARLRQQFIELENRLIQLRMVPLTAIFERASRTSRLAARATGKEVVFEVSGGDVSIDKSLAVAIAEPLMHLVRNAVDHGIEFPEERIASGKNAAGHIRLSAVSESNRVQIYVGDDGRGIDPARVARAAAEREIIADPATVTFDQCLRLIFRPGFSTAAEVSDTSGRGIGLEIVDRAMADTGGEVRVRTEQGKGTTFQLILPATLALVSTVLVQVGRNLYHIDARCVVESGAMATAAFETSFEQIDGSGGRKIQWRGKALALHNLRDLLGQSNGEPETEAMADTRSWLVVRSGTAASSERQGASGEHIALIVDRIEGEQQALVRSLGRYAARWRGVAGANELRDGSVALVLDIPQLLEAANG